MGWPHVRRRVGRAVRRTRGRGTCGVARGTRGASGARKAPRRGTRAAGRGLEGGGCAHVGARARPTRACAAQVFGPEWGGYNQPSCRVCKLCKVLERESPRGVPRDFFFSARPRKKKKILGGPRDFQPQESPQTLQGSPTPTHAPTHPPSACGCSLVPHRPHRTPASTASGRRSRAGAALAPSGRGGGLWGVGANGPNRTTRPPSALGGPARVPRARERRSADAWAPGRGRPGGANLSG